MKGKSVDFFIQKPFGMEQILHLVQEGMVLSERLKAG